jgi:tetratricopeptide (TPR) repeat protein
MLALIRPLGLAAVLCGLVASTARAQNEGQEFLDRATEKKITAESLADLNEVVQLCEQALEKGLDDSNTKFANSLLTGTLVQRAGVLTAAIFERATDNPRWPQIRGLAVKDLERAIKIDDKLGEAHYLIAKLHALPAGDLDRARKAIEQAIEHTKKDPLVHAKSLTLRANLTEVDFSPQNDEEKEKAARAIEKRMADYEAAIKLAPGDNEAVRSRGLFRLMQGKFEEAVADLDESIKIEPEEAATHEARGVALLALKKLDEAKESLSKAIELNPDAPLPYMHRGRVKAEQKDFADALVDMNKALNLEPENVAARFFRARLHQQQGNKKEARDDLDVLLKSRPGMAAALELRAVVAAGSGDFQTAITDFEELLKLSPDNAELLTQIGLLYQADKKPTAAIEKFTQALEHDKKILFALRGRADSYLSVGKQAEAIADYEEAIKIDPKNSSVLNNLAWVLATSPEDKLRDAKRSIELATRACEVSEYKEAHILSTLAAGYAEAGQWDEALKWSRKAVEMGDESIKDQLKKELASYEDKKPWRERQDMAEKDDDRPKDDTASKTESVLKK